jgi:signal transduction histidine kinase/DNA-binding response OmpR family regulator
MNERKSLSNSIRLRQGLVGQCAFERQRILLTNVPPDYVRISSGLGEAQPLNIVVLPVIFENEVLAVIELASFNRLTAVHLSFLDQLVESIGIVLNTISASMRTEDLLKQSQILTKELQSQQAELKSTNDRLEQQAMSMRQSEELLKTQQEELRAKNEELEEKASQLQAEKRQVEAINREVETARSALEEKAEQLALTSKYKSEFLANMSHELRTPLNSLLILSKLLADNSRGNLSEKQIEHARTIYGAGSDLLRMINDILDLSKIESGTVTLDIGAMSFDQFRQHSERTFRELAEERKLEFTVEIDPNLPAGMLTDSMRLQQIINNLLSNAFKFTEEGSVRLTVAPGPASENYQNPRLAAAESVIAFAISDTGIGITPSQQQIIFEAFQQADGTTSRRYGGTGLGLSISRELAALLGGEIRLVSTPGEGSTFTLLLPLDPVTEDVRAAKPELALQAAVKPAEKKAAEPMPRATGSRRTGRPLIAIVEDDPVFARILLDIADEQGFEGLVVSCGRELPPLLREHRPDAISLDIQLPDIDGWALLDLVRQDRELRHLPIHVISVVDDEELLRRKNGIEYSGKPISREQLGEAFERLHRLATRRDRRVLLARSGRTRSPLEKHLKSVEFLGLEALPIREAARRAAAGGFDCIVVTARQAGPDLAKLVEAARSSAETADVPVIVALSEPAPDDDLAPLAEAGVRVFVADEAGDGPLFDEVACALHLPTSVLPPEMVSVICGAPKRDALLDGRKIMIIDDDIRNIFSMTALLEEHQAVVVSAEDGRSGIQLLDREPDAAAVLVDIMMPGMDGYETIRRIRRSEKLRNLPLIAVTAKAMPEDREKCFEAGASDYLSKPVDKDELIAVLRTWMKRRYGDTDARG